MRVEVETLAHYAEMWILDRKARSERTRALRKVLTKNFLWYLRRQDHASCGTDEIEEFLAYLERDHSLDGGRWGIKELTRPAKPQTSQSYFSALRALFNFLVRRGRIPVSPMQTVEPPRFRAEQIQPFDQDEVDRFFAAARASRHPLRDTAILLLLYDTGIRSSELCGITYGAIDFEHNSVTVNGKGGVQRDVYFGPTTYGALFDFVFEGQRRRPSKRDYKRTGRLPESIHPPKPTDPVFRGDRQTAGTGALTRSGLQQLIERLGTAAGVTKKRCSPHTWRHTFAVNFLRTGGNTFSLQRILGHTSLAMTRRYVMMAESDIERDQQAFSPVEAMMDRRRNGR